MITGHILQVEHLQLAQDSILFNTIYESNKSNNSIYNNTN